jgi:peptidoglycan/LPS O-acetylase OafA/YrhL
VALVSYSLYLLHAPIGKTVFGLGLDYTLALLISVSLAGAASAACYFCVERPSSRFARYLIGSLFRFALIARPQS